MFTEARTCSEMSSDMIHRSPASPRYDSPTRSLPAWLAFLPAAAAIAAMLSPAGGALAGGAAPSSAGTFTSPRDAVGPLCAALMLPWTLPEGDAADPGSRDGIASFIGVMRRLGGATAVLFSAGTGDTTPGGSSDPA